MSEQATQQNTQATQTTTAETAATHTGSESWNTAKPPEKTFTQAELDSIVGKRLAKAMKGMPEAEELTEFRTWKESKQTEQQKQEAKAKELTETKAALTAAQAKLEQYEREKFLIGKGVPTEDVDYYAFKIGKLVTDTVDFETAAEQYLTQAGIQASGMSGMKVNFTAPLSGGGAPKTPNEQMNNILRNFRK